MIMKSELRSVVSETIIEYLDENVVLDESSVDAVTDALLDKMADRFPVEDDEEAEADEDESY